MTDVAKLKQRIADSGYKLYWLAGKCGLTYPGFKAKLDGEQEFKQSEIKALCAILQIDSAEMEELFFA